MQQNNLFKNLDVQRNDKPKVAYFPWNFAAHVKNIYPDYEFIPFHLALRQKDKIEAVVGFKGKGAFLAKLFGFRFWTLHEGLYRLSGNKPCSFILERFGNYNDARKASEWEEWIQSIPTLLSIFGNDTSTIENVFAHFDEDEKKESSNQANSVYTLSPFMKSVLKRLPSAFPSLDPHDREEAKELVDSLLKARLSSDRYAPDAPPYQLSTPAGRKRIVIIDEERMKKNELGKVLVKESAFMRMFETAKKEHSGAAFFLLEPKSVRSNKKHGYLRKIAEVNGVKVLDNDVSSISILAQADVIYTVSSLLGIDAIFLGKKVHCFGMPFYAGWGLTHDILQVDRRNVKRTREEFFAAICLFFTRYRHPITKEACSFQEILRFIILQRPLSIERGRYIACINFNDKLKAFCQRFFYSSHLHFMSQEKAILAAKEHHGIIFTAEEPNEEMRKACGNIPLVFVNIGVLDRLLGQEKFVSLSLEGGPYPTLERILQTSKANDEDLLRARLFRQYLREISAFRTHYDFNHVPQDKTIVLLIGNVLLPPHKLDAIKKQNIKECPLGSDNLDTKGLPVHSFSSPLSDDAALIQHIRSVRKDAYIVYCPQIQGMDVPESILKHVDDIKEYAKPSDFVPLSVLGIAPDLCDGSANSPLIDDVNNSVENKNEEYSNTSPTFVIDDQNECLPQFEGTDFIKWSRKHVAAKRFLEKAHTMTSVNGQFCPLYFPLHTVSGHKIEVHTYDSYLGLDALAVGMDVFTYGWPFYAGWGLTEDEANFPMRTRPMNLDNLFAGAFILQPRYFDSLNGIFCEPGNTPYLLTRDSKK